MHYMNDLVIPYVQRLAWDDLTEEARTKYVTKAKSAYPGARGAKKSSTQTKRIK